MSRLKATDHQEIKQTQAQSSLATTAEPVSRHGQRAAELGNSQFAVRPNRQKVFQSGDQLVFFTLVGSMISERRPERLRSMGSLGRCEDRR